MDICASGNSMYKCIVVKKTKVLQGRTKGAVMVVRGRVAGQGVSKAGQTWTEGCPTLWGIEGFYAVECPDQIHVFK